jgi:hypothetical protein
VSAAFSKNCLGSHFVKDHNSGSPGPAWLIPSRKVTGEAVAARLRLFSSGSSFGVMLGQLRKFDKSPEEGENNYGEQKANTSIPRL